MNRYNVESIIGAEKINDSAEDIAGQNPNNMASVNRTDLT